MQEKFSSAWMKENMGIQEKKTFLKKNCDERKPQWNGIIVNNK